MNSIRIALALFLVPSLALGSGAVRRKELKVPEYQEDQWGNRWSRAVARIVSLARKETVNPCVVATDFNRPAGGKGDCCPRDPDDAREGTIVKGCKGPQTVEQAVDVLGWAYQLKYRLVPDPVSFETIVENIDRGSPLLMAKYDGDERIIVGYDDTPNHRDRGIKSVGVHTSGYDDIFVDPSYFKRHWHATWVLTGQNPGKATVLEAIVPAKPNGPATASIAAELPAIPDGPARVAVLKRLAPQLPSLRVCYEAGLLEKPPAAPEAKITLSFSIENGQLMWIRTVESVGLTSSSGRCVSEAVSKLRGLFSAGGPYEESQTLQLRFAKLK